ncbi:tetratricopeptide repeat protein [Amycolatopsis thailandensis]|uniref:tetratricopeptide repeat protein n=1 Tax=Amycolatopsis thailandensis TaxID=589330 RepID=UPI00363E130D
MDLTEISTLSQLAGALKGLIRDRSLSLQGLADAAADLPTRGGRRPALPRSTASDLLNAKSVPEVETVVTFLAACGIHHEEAQRPWLRALDRVANSHQRRPPGAVRVRDARPRMLGVHAAIQVGQLAGDGPVEAKHDDLPLYVPRDFDADLHTKITLAGQQGGFVLVTGDSSVGKTRALFEAVRVELPDWWLLHPGNVEALREFAVAPAPRTVVWLDELQSYLDFHGGVPAGEVRSMIEAGVVLAATCWPGQRTKRVALPALGEPDPYANDRRLLDLADVLTVPDTFSFHERRRAEFLARTDRRIRVALDTPDAGFTQVMAAGPELIRHWEHAPVYAKAVITAALDARRVGAHAPLARDYLEAAAPGYLTNRQQATPPPHWLDDALAYATELLHGATATLCPVAAGMGTITGYRVADYLHQHALRARRTEHLPDTAWHALVRHHHPDDTELLATSAGRRGRSREAIVLHQELIDRNSAGADRTELIGLLAEQGRVNEALGLMSAHGDDNGWITAFEVGDRLAEQELKDEAISFLGPYVENCGGFLLCKLADLLADQGRPEEAISLLRRHAENGDHWASYSLAKLLPQQGLLEEAIRLFRSDAEDGDRSAAFELAELLSQQGRLEEAISLLRPHAENTGDELGIYALVDLLADHERPEEAIRLLRPHAEKGAEWAVSKLTELLVEMGRVDEAIILCTRVEKIWEEEFSPLFARSDEGWLNLSRLAALLARQGQAEKAISLLSRHAEKGDGFILSPLAELLADQDRIEEALSLLRPYADAGDSCPLILGTLASLLIKQGRSEEVINLLTRHAEGNVVATGVVIRVLAQQELRDELQAEVAAGTPGAIRWLRYLLGRAAH